MILLHKVLSIFILYISTIYHKWIWGPHLNQDEHVFESDSYEAEYIDYHDIGQQAGDLNIFDVEDNFLEPDSAGWFNVSVLCTLLEWS